MADRVTVDLEFTPNPNSLKYITNPPLLERGAINFKGKVGLYVFTENLDRHLYRQILNEQLYDNADVLVGGRWIFQQDNEPKHTSRDVQNDLNTRLPRRVLALPPYSPDLNPIENIWAVLKHNVEKHVKKMIAQKKKCL